MHKRAGIVLRIDIDIGEKRRHGTCIGEMLAGLCFEIFYDFKLKSGIDDFLCLTILNADFYDVYKLACHIANDTFQKLLMIYARPSAAR